MVTFIKFFFSKHFWLNLLAMLLLSIFLIWFSFKALDIYTNHGESITVPDLRKFNLVQVQKHLESKDLQYTIIDSTYVKDKPANVIIAQNPKPGAKVKENRRIYLTINAKTAPIVKLPNIMYASLRNAEIQLKSLGLEVGALEHIPDLAKNAVLGIKYKGKSVEPGMNIPKGSPIGLVLGDGLGNTRIPIPDLVGLTYHEAKLALSALSLNVGTVLKDPKVWSEDEALVYEQRPAPSPDGGGKMIAIGEPIDLLLRSPKYEPAYDRAKLIEAATPKPKAPPEEEEELEGEGLEGAELPSSELQGFAPTPPRPLEDEPEEEVLEVVLEEEEEEEEATVVETAVVPVSPPRPVPPKPAPRPKAKPKPQPIVAKPKPEPKPVVAKPEPKPQPKPVVTKPQPKPPVPPKPEPVREEPPQREEPLVITPKKTFTPPPAPPAPKPVAPKKEEPLVITPKKTFTPPPAPKPTPPPPPAPKPVEKVVEQPKRTFTPPPAPVPQKEAPLVIVPKKKAKPIIKMKKRTTPESNEPAGTDNTGKSTWKKTRIFKAKPNGEGGE